MRVDPIEQYKALMTVISGRYAQIKNLLQTDPISSQDSETIGFQLRKIIEGVAFGCLVAVENGMKFVPRDASGQWNADRVFAAMKKRGAAPLPNPNVQRPPNADELDQYPGIKYVMEGQPQLCLTHDQISEIYKRTHKWTHEANPYLGRKIEDADVQQLKSDVEAVWQMLEFHIIGINGESFWCDMKDLKAGPKIASATKVGDYEKIEAVR